MDSDRSSIWPKLIGGVVVLLVAIAAYSYFGGDDEKVSYETTDIERKTVEAFVAATGNIESTTTVTVGSQVSGPVSQVLVDFNSPVKKGQVLAKIDPSEFVARQESELARLQSAQAGLTSSQASLVGQDAAVRRSGTVEDVKPQKLKHTMNDARMSSSE